MAHRRMPPPACSCRSTWSDSTAICRSTDDLPSSVQPPKSKDADTCGGERPDCAPSSDVFDLVLASDVLYSSALATSLSRAAATILDKQAPSLMLISHTLRFSVTWGPDREPLLETSDSVLDSFFESLRARGASSRIVAQRDEHAVLVP